MTQPIRVRLRQILPRDLLIDLDDAVQAGSLKAHAVVRDHSGLKKKRNAREPKANSGFVS
jgi:hypothetical protein